MRAVSIPVMAVSAAAADHESLEINKVVCIVDQSPECADALRIAAAMAPDARLILLKPREDDRPQQAAESLMRLRRWLPAELVDRCELRLVDPDWSAEHLANFAATVGADLIAAGGSRSWVSDRIGRPPIIVSGAKCRCWWCDRGCGVSLAGLRGLAVCERDALPLNPSTPGPATSPRNRSTY
jgi:hypothetical protein